MSAVNDFLIKSAGMEKEARTAIAKRLLASTMTPDEVLKRFGKVKGQRYLDDVITATKNAINSKPEHTGSISPLTYLRREMVRNAAQTLYFNNKLSKSDYIKHLDSREAFMTGARAHQRLLRLAGKDTGLREIYPTLPRQDRLIVSKYLRGMVPDSSIQHLSDQTQQAALAARSKLMRPDSTTLPSKDSYARTLQSQYGIKTREELLGELQAHGITYDPETLRHSHYVTGVKDDMRDDVDYTHILRAATKLPFTSTDRLPAQLAALKDVAVTSGRFSSIYRGANTAELPRSVQKALQITRGENLLKPGTRANRLFNKVYNNKTLWNKLGLDTGTDIQQYIDGKNASYWPNIDALLISKAMANKGTEAHELGHRAAHIMPPEEHADTAFNTFRKMQLLGNKHDLRIPLGNSRFMQEVFAESYIPKLLGPNSGEARFISPEMRVQKFLEHEGGGPEYNYKDLLEGVSNRYKTVEDRLSAMQATEDTKDLFRQLAYNYGLAVGDALPIPTIRIRRS